MYSIYEINDKFNEKIIKNIDNPYSFLSSIVKYLENKNISCKLLQNISLETITNNHVDYTIGSYLLDNGLVLQLVEKTNDISVGYIYNTTIISTKILYTWKLLENDINDTNKKIYLDEFSLDNIKPCPSFFLCGHRGSGRSIVIKNIINALNKTNDFIENTLIINGTERYWPFYKYIFPNATIISKYNSDLVKRHISNGKGCIVLDDCVLSKTTDESGNTSLNTIPDELFDAISKHKIPIIYSTQYCDRYHQCINNLSDYSIRFDPTSFIERSQWYMMYSDIFETYEDFNDVCDRYITDYTTIVIDNTITNYNINDRVFWYKAQYHC